MNKLVIAIILIALSFNTLASEQCGVEEERTIKMLEKNLNQGTVSRSSTMAYARITVGTAGMIYGLLNTATAVGLLSAVIFIGGSMDIYINRENDKKIDELEERLCH